MKVISEIWRASALEVVTTYECDSYEPITAMTLEWNDFMQMNISAAITPEQGLQIGAKLLGRSDVTSPRPHLG